MNSVIHKQGPVAIVYDAEIMGSPSTDYFSVDYWKLQKALVGEAVGRGSAWFVDAPFGSMVLRRYLRGGWAAKLSQKSYFFTTVSRSRPFREYHLMASLFEHGLPVPRPIAALCEFHGVISTGTILTTRISSAQTLADVLPGNSDSLVLADGFWESVGKCIRKFHDAGVWHADLNARNILLDAEFRIFLIDFDRARFTPGKLVNGQGNLKRLHRSLAKLWPGKELSAMESAWSRLEAGYHG
jgi:3-deoxy-D-manno-octulosonic acid kinase